MQTAITTTRDTFDTNLATYRKTEATARNVVKSCIASQKPVKIADIEKEFGNDVTVLAMHGLLTAEKRGLITIARNVEQLSFSAQFDIAEAKTRFMTAQS